MNVLTWHGAVLRVDSRRHRLIQDPLWLTGIDGADFVLDATSPNPMKTPLGDLHVEAAERPGTVRLRFGSRYLRAAPTHRELSLDQEDNEPDWETFLVLGQNDLADLRYILDNRWRLRPGNRLLEKADIRVTPGFGLELGPVRLDLAMCLPLGSSTRRTAAHGDEAFYRPPASFVLSSGDESAESIELANAMQKSLTPGLDFEIVPRRQAPPAEVETREDFMRGTHCRLILPVEEARFVSPPMVVRSEDHDQFVRFAGQARTPSVGFVSTTCEMRREPKRYVALSRGCEGFVFDQDGSSSDIDLLGAAQHLPTGFSRRGAKICVERDALQDAPKLEGPLLVFYDGRLHGYSAWLIGAMAALDAMTRQVPRSCRLLLPGTLLQMQRRPNAFNHREIMNLLGFSRLPAVEGNADIVWVDDVIFMDRPTPESIPADQLTDFRDRVLKPFGGRGERNKRIYIKRAGAGGVAERHDIERFLAVQGFEHVQLEHLTHEQQLTLFQEAAYVVGAHGGGLSNLVFSSPGVKVLELMPDDEFRPRFWTLANKLGHVYGFLSCPSAERLVPDFQAFRDLFHMLEAYQA
jgi:hypothetical protein